MLVYCFALVGRRFEEAEAALLQFPEMLSASAVAAYRDGERLRTRVGPAAPLAKTVHLSAGPALRRGDHTSISLTWEAAGGRVLFPRMEADLALAPLGIDYSHLSFSGSYEPPLGALGAAADRLLLHRVAEATVKRFTEAVAVALASPDHPAQPVEAR